MNKTDIKTEFVNLLSSLEDDGIEITGWGNDNFEIAPFVEYKILNKSPILIQDRIERFTSWSFLVRIYANSSVEATEISDTINELLLPLGFSEAIVGDTFDSNSRKFTLTSVYTIKIDENGISYNIK